MTGSTTITSITAPGLVLTRNEAITLNASGALVDTVTSYAANGARPARR